MHFSEQDLEAALRRKDPGPEFTKRVVNAIGSAKQKSSIREGRGIFGWWGFRFAPAVGGAIAIVLLAIMSWLGVVRYHDHQNQIAQAEKARQQAILALRITQAKLNHVLRHVSQQDAPQPKIRRQTL